MTTHSEISIRRGLWLSLRVLIANLIVALVIVAVLVLIVATAAHAEAGCGTAEVEQLHSEGRTLAQEEQLRGENGSLGLPDCRAYEMVTPPFKGGELPFTFAFNESSFYFSSLGAFGGAGDNTTPGGSVYLAGRGTGGWSSEPVELAASEFFNQYGGATEAISDTSRDLSAAVYIRAPSSSNVVDQRLYLERPGVGVQQVGPMIPAAAVAAWSKTNAENAELPEVEYAGSSPDLSHILFNDERLAAHTPEANFFLWPDDTTVFGRSLYEYVGAGHTGVGGDVPALVAVGDGHVVVDGVTVPAGQPISQCGGILGDTGQETTAGKTKAAYNAVSERSGLPEVDEGVPVTAEEGARVFFTAPKRGCGGRDASGEGVTGEGPLVNQLFARVNGTRTVSISEPTKTACTACDTKEAEEPALASDEPEAEQLRADFQGASSDGSRVFWLSRQKLLPGAENTNLYEYDFRAVEGERVRLIAPDLAKSTFTSVLTYTVNAGVVRIAASGSRVFFVSNAVLATNHDAKGELPVEGGENLYAFDTATGRHTFVAELASTDKEEWKYADEAREAELTPDGRFLLFASRNDVTRDASGSSRQFYRYDAQAGEANAEAEEEGHSASATALVRVTIGEEGYSGDGNAHPMQSPQIIAPNYSYQDRVQPQALSITDDGSQVFFISPLGLTPQALNNACAESTPEETEGECTQGAAENVYEYENGHVYLLTDGKDRKTGQGSNSEVTLLGATPSGSNVFIGTGDQLTPEDTDTGLDVYDVRVDGGFPAPVAPTGCEGETCRGPLPAAPVFGAPSSATLTGAGNLTPPPTAAAPKKATKKTVKCAKGKKLVRGKCVKSVRKRQAGRRSSIRQSNRRSN